MSDLDRLLTKLAQNTTPNKIPPVMDWHPQRQGAVDISIDRQGRWFHEGREIKRAPLVKVFSTVLRKDPDGYVLVTPAERLLVQVEDVPFIGVDIDVSGQGQDLDVVVTTNVGDYVSLSAEHPLTMKDGIPYIEVRFGLRARLTRSAFYRLVDVGFEEADEWVIYSQQTRFPLGPTALS